MRCVTKQRLNLSCAISVGWLWDFQASSQDLRQLERVKIQAERDFPSAASTEWLLGSKSSVSSMDLHQQRDAWFLSSNHVTVKQSPTCRAEAQCLISLLLVPSNAGPCPATLMQSGGSQAALSQPEQHLLSQGQSCSDTSRTKTVPNAPLHPVRTSKVSNSSFCRVRSRIKTRSCNGCRVHVISPMHPPPPATTSTIVCVGARVRASPSNCTQQ